ncbi:DNA gyrase subunit b [Cyclospora cayetanensis]|uniref:DNA topoisomerase (ATP-hydrolyzing) n=1 Tax=Cyclospora cayetanensis TaxID=88456 RepID=A0A1D3CQX2_9EIME|nr:DNA gyrase subunit b [Cyclospora cayetanensis]
MSGWFPLRSIYGLDERRFSKGQRPGGPLMGGPLHLCSQKVSPRDSLRRAPQAAAARNDGCTEQQQSQQASYTAKDIRVLEGLEAVRLRPGMYVGDSDASGALHLLMELLQNSADEIAQGNCTEITVWLHHDSLNTVARNLEASLVSRKGAGCLSPAPSDGSPAPECPSALEVVLTTLHSGGKFVKAGSSEGAVGATGAETAPYSCSGGLHGVGLPVLNALSSRLRAEHQGTAIRYHPDRSIFGEAAVVPWQKVAERLRELSFLYPQTVFHLKRERAYCSADTASAAKQETEEAAARAEARKEAEIGDGSERQGTAGSAEKESEEPLIQEIRFKDEGGGLKSMLREMSHGLAALFTDTPIISVVCSNAFLSLEAHLMFTDPTKTPNTAVRTPRSDCSIERQSRSEASSGLASELQRLSPLAVPADTLGCSIASFVNGQQEAADSAKAAATPGSGRGVAGAGASGLAAGAAGVKGEYLREGLVGIARDRRLQAVLPLRGKILNVQRENNRRKIFNNEEVKALVSALGVPPQDDSSKQQSLTGLRYGKVILLTDADVDGAHIRSLLLGFFYRFYTALLRENKLFIACPPLYKAVHPPMPLALLQQHFKQLPHTRDSRGTVSSSTVTETYVWTDAEAQRLAALVQQQHPKKKTTQAAYGEAGGGGILRLQRFKGLGEMQAEQLWQTTMDPRARSLKRITLQDAAKAEAAVSSLMGEAPMERRQLVLSLSASLAADPQALST